MAAYSMPSAAVTQHWISTPSGALDSRLTRCPAPNRSPDRAQAFQMPARLGP